MTDDERERIRREEREAAGLENRVKNLEDRIKWLAGAAWAGVAYLAIKFIETLGGKS